MEEDQELHGVGGGHRPERVLPFAVDVGDQGCDRVGEGVLVEVFVGEGVVAVVGVEGNLEVVLPTAHGPQHLADLLAEVAFDLEHQAPKAPFGVVGRVAEELKGDGPDEGRSLAGADGAEARHSGVEALLGEGDPGRVWDPLPLGRVMALAQDDVEVLALLRWLVGGQLAAHGCAPSPMKVDEEERQRGRVEDERGREQE